MKIAITGISGHIGNNVARVLLKRGHSITALVQNENSRSIKDIQANYIKGDLFNNNALDQVCSDAEVLVHLAGKISMHSSERENTYKVNIDGVKQVIEACQRNSIKRVIHFSSIHAHIPLGYNKVMNEDTPYIESEEIAYDFSKSMGEQLMIEARKSGINVCIVNPTAVIGPFDFQPSLSGKMIIDVFSGKLPSLIKGGFDWIDVRDIAIAVADIIDKEIDNEKFVLSGHWAELIEIANMICSVKGEKYKGFNSSILLAKIGLPFITFWSKISGSTPLYNWESIKAIEEGSNLIENDHAAQIIDYSPRPLQETINDSIAWFKNNKMF